ncbi:hypothetical protein ACM43_09850 [Bradyrhizobium sp. CCBAU 45321]|nr:hypothetical protein [Bradyrhizobium sp. CCBAU 45321]
MIHATVSFFRWLRLIVVKLAVRGRDSASSVHVRAPSHVAANFIGRASLGKYTVCREGGEPRSRQERTPQRKMGSTTR